MPQLYIYEPQEQAFTLHTLGTSELMPGMRTLPMRMEDFLYLAYTDVAWTHRDALDALDELCESFGQPFQVDLAFRFPRRDSGLRLTQHSAGLAFEIGRSLPPKRREELYRTAVASRLFCCVSPPYLTGRSVRVAMAGRLPTLNDGCVGVHVFMLQAAMVECGLYFGALTGRYCQQTSRGVCRLQHRAGLPVNGRMDSRTWHCLDLALRKDGKWMRL